MVCHAELILTLYAMPSLDSTAKQTGKFKNEISEILLLGPDSLINDTSLECDVRKWRTQGTHKQVGATTMDVEVGSTQH